MPRRARSTPATARYGPMPGRTYCRNVPSSASRVRITPTIAVRVAPASLFTAARPDEHGGADGGAESQWREERREAASEGSRLEGDELDVHSGPTTMKASRAVSENCVRLAATKASASEQMARTTARRAEPETASAPWAANAVEHRAEGTKRLQRGGRRRHRRRGSRRRAGSRGCSAVSRTCSARESLVALAAPRLAIQQVVATLAEPHEPDDDRRRAAAHEPGQHHLRSPREGHGCGDQDDRVHRRRREEERQRRGRRDAAGDEPPGDRAPSRTHTRAEPRRRPPATGTARAGYAGRSRSQGWPGARRAAMAPLTARCRGRGRATPGRRSTTKIVAQLLERLGVQPADDERTRDNGAEHDGEEHRQRTRLGRAR